MRFHNKGHGHGQDILKQFCHLLFLVMAVNVKSVFQTNISPIAN